MKLKYIALIAVYAGCLSCKDGDMITVRLDPESTFDTIYMTELITEKDIAELPANSEIKNIPLDYTTIADIHTKNNEKQYLTIWTPGKELVISETPDAGITTNDTGDSLVNDLRRGTLNFIQRNSALIFNPEVKDSVPGVFENFRKEREAAIDRFREVLNSEVIALLHFQNDTRIYSFLFWLGRISKKLDADDPYFDFITDIPEPGQFLKTLPDVYLYRYEVEYLRANRSIADIPAFLRFIEAKTGDKDLSDFLKVIYIRALIENPSYWESHEQLFTSELLTQVLETEKSSNSYYRILEKPIAGFYASRNGQEAFLFEAEDESGKSFHLESFKGKVIFIDVWATWCAPCVQQRPEVLELAEKYKENDDVKILLVSVDSSRERWLSFLENETTSPGTNLYIENGMRTEFGDHYNIRSIPRYILIGKDGKIADSQMTGLSLETENKIEKELSRNNYR